MLSKHHVGTRAVSQGPWQQSGDKERSKAGQNVIVTIGNASSVEEHDIEVNYELLLNLPLAWLEVDASELAICMLICAPATY